jgi:hypothetical protein
MFLTFNVINGVMENISLSLWRQKHSLSSRESTHTNYDKLSNNFLNC